MSCSRDAQGDPGDPALIATPAADGHSPSPSHSSTSPPPRPPFPPQPGGVTQLAIDAGEACYAAGQAAPSKDDAQGFLAKRVPRALLLDPKALPPPFSSPGDAFLQFVLENFSSLVCSPVSPGSPLFAPSPVHIMVKHRGQDHVPLSLVCSMLKFWLGSAFENLDVF
jgi:hypothetical protein